MISVQQKYFDASLFKPTHKRTEEKPCSEMWPVSIVNIPRDDDEGYLFFNCKIN